MTNSFAETALDYAMDNICESASPWRMPTEVYDETRKQFAADFEQWITDDVSWGKWQEIVRRQARSVGALAAFVADLENGKGFRLPKAGDLTLDDVRLATQGVKLTCRVPARGTAVRGRLCNEAFVATSGTKSVGAELFTEVMRAALER
jgi:hypothetical protein